MNRKVIGIVLLIAGVALAFWGYDVYSSVGSKLGRAISGDTPIEAWLGMVGGAVCFILGIIKVK